MSMESLVATLKKILYQCNAVFVLELCVEFPQQKSQIIKTPTAGYLLGV